MNQSQQAEAESGSLAVFIMAAFLFFLTLGFCLAHIIAIQGIQEELHNIRTTIQSNAK